ncbi:neural cell adhesion molecule L1-like protein isoform X6 [Takifugu flavidus]|uniref:neural cell adhesion molecule L1-like protein isoform X6 n=1 Tax=Takifugu flavidus TaxID=433684 RepID=UPI0025443DFE|nr:neural cell adhesion molecule L1-like protein isoform X6 [Takifugu flavidus]
MLSIDAATRDPHSCRDYSAERFNRSSVLCKFPVKASFYTFMYSSLLSNQRAAMRLQLLLLLALSPGSTGLDIPLEVEQLPTITSYSSGPIIVLPFDKTVKIQCEARGNPPPEYRWTKDGEGFVPPRASTTKTQHTDGSFELHNKQFIQFQGVYRCYAFNKLGTAMTEDIQLIVPTAPSFPKVGVPPIVVDEGDPITLHCNPPKGAVPRQLFWMSLDLQLIQQDERVSMGTDGNLYFAHALKNDTRQDYCCNAKFPKLRTMVQKIGMAISVRSLPEAPPMRMPSMLLPPGVQTEKVVLKGERLQLECIPGGYPIPKIKWMKMGEKLSSRTQFDNFGKLLLLSDTEENDGGKYMCKAQNAAGEAVHYFDVIVEEQPKWLTEPPRDQLTVIGSDVHIKCSVSGKPPPDITWRKNGEPFTDDPQNNRRVLDDTVVLHNAGPEDTAVYQCDASNSHGSLLANINIMVMNMAPRILTRDSQEYPVVQGADVVMNCSVFGSPPPTVSWSRGATQETIEGGRFNALQNGSLQIIGVEKEDGGKYVCVALNAEGKSAVSAMLEVKDPTRIISRPQDAEVVSGTTAQLNCLAEYDKSLQDSFELVWRKDGEDIPLAVQENSRHGVDGAVLQIINVDLSDNGLYTCVARTSLDEENATALLTVLDVPDAPLKLEISEIRSPRNISLSWVPGSDHNSSVTEFVVEYEESQWEPGRWRDFQKVPGNQATAVLALQGDLDYKFRVYAVNAVGPGPPSDPTERHKTPPAAPEKNPQSIKIQGHRPHQMDISWEPLLPIEHNGPGLEYKVSYRRLGVEEEWKEHLVKRHSFVVRNVSTFVPYEVKIQSRNNQGWGPEPKVVTGYSGEDVPAAAPRDVAVEVFNTTALRVSWTPVSPATVRGHLGGYKIHWSRLRSLMNLNKTLDERQSLLFPGRRTQAIVPGLEPFSEYRLTVSVYNKKGNGPNSDPVIFRTPEGVPAQVPILTAYKTQKNSVLLEWGSPLQTNGILIGYLLQCHHINKTTMEVVDSREVNITVADTTQWQIQGLEEGSLYRFLLSGCTQAGCGPPLVQESVTVAQTRLVLLNISSFVSDTFARISWNAGDSQRNSQFYVAYMNNRDGNWRISEAVNTSQSFHVIDGLKPGAVYTIRLMAKGLLDNASIFEDIIQTQVKGVESQLSGFSTESWIIGTMCAVALLVLIALTVCLVRRNIGGKYAGTPPPPQRQEMFSMEKVKEKEDLHPDVESQEMNDDTFCEYSDSEEKPLKGASSRSLHGHDTAGDSISRDSLVEYADGGGEFSEDGSFIGEYSGCKRAGSVSEHSDAGTVTA